MSKQNSEIQSYYQMLREIADLCDHATLTGSMSSGSSRVAVRYNSTLTRLVELEAIPRDYFMPLPETISYGEIGVEARMLASFVKGAGREEKHRDASVIMRLAPFVDSKDLGEMVRGQVKAGNRPSMEMLTQLAPFLDRETLSGLVREHLGEEAEVPAEPVVPAPPVVSPPPVRVDGSAAPRVPGAPTEVKPTMDELIERLKYPYLSSEQRNDLLDQIRNLSS